MLSHVIGLVNLKVALFCEQNVIYLLLFFKHSSNIAKYILSIKEFLSDTKMFYIYFSLYVAKIVS